MDLVKNQLSESCHFLALSATELILVQINEQMNGHKMLKIRIETTQLLY